MATWQVIDQYDYFVIIIQNDDKLTISHTIIIIQNDDKLTISHTFKLRLQVH